MVLLLMIYKDYNIAVDMRQVTRIADTGKFEPEPDRWLMEPLQAPSAVVLKNEFLIPAHRIVKITGDSQTVQPTNTLLEGCMKKQMFNGFAAVKDRIYAVLDINGLTRHFNGQSTPTQED